MSRRMSTKHIRPVADLVRFKCALRITCGACGNANTVSGYQVVQASGKLDLQQFQAKLKCSLCGAREAVLSTIRPPPPRN